MLAELSRAGRRRLGRGKQPLGVVGDPHRALDHLLDRLDDLVAPLGELAGVVPQRLAGFRQFAERGRRAVHREVEAVDRLVGGFGDALDQLLDLDQGRGGLVVAALLLLRDREEASGALGDRAGRGLDAVGRGGHLTDRPRELVGHLLEGAHHVADLVAAGGLVQPPGEVALPDAMCGELHRLDRADEPARDDEAHREGQGESERGRDAEVEARVVHRGPFGLQRRRHPQREAVEGEHLPLELCGRVAAGGAERDLGAAQLGPHGEGVLLERLDGHQSPRAGERRAHHRVGPTLVGHEPARLDGERRGVERRYPGGRGDATVRPHEGDAGRVVLPEQGVGVVGEGGSVVDLEGGAKLRRPGDGPVALGHGVEVAIEQALRGHRGVVEPLLGGALEIGREVALLQEQHEPGARRRHAAHHGEQPTEESADHVPAPARGARLVAQRPSRPKLSSPAPSRRDASRHPQRRVGTRRIHEGFRSLGRIP